jgi:hypothetical protein
VAPWVVHRGKPLQISPPRSGRHPDVHTPSWIESPTFSEIAEAKVLLVEICSLKDGGLPVEAIVADFVLKNIQPLKDMIYPAYLYSGVSDSSWVSNRRIPNEDLLIRLDMILRGRVSNAGAPVAYSAWNLPPNRPFSEFVSNPPARDSSPAHRVRPSLEDIEALIAPLQSLPEDERQTHFEMPANTDDAEMDAVLSVLARESSDSTRIEPMAITTGQEFGEEAEIRRPEGARPKRSHWVNRPTAPVEEKKKKRQLQRLSCLDQDAGPSVPIPDDVPTNAIPEVDVGVWYPIAHPRLPLEVLLGRTVLLTVARWFVLGARETIGNFLQVRAAWRGVIPYFLVWIFMWWVTGEFSSMKGARELSRWLKWMTFFMMGYPLGLIYPIVGHYMRVW